MSAVHLCTDSSALLTDDEASRRRIGVVPVRVALDGEPFEGDTDDFYERLAAGATATTSAPSPGDLLAAYRRASEYGAPDVLSLHLDARVSGTVASAELAAREAPVPVTVVDTGTTSFGVALCVRAAAAAVAAGAQAREAAATARELGATLDNVFVTGRASGGRLGDVAAWTILRLAGGRVEQGETCASPADAAAVMTARILGATRPLNVAVGHAADLVEPWADELASRLRDHPLVAGVERYRVGPPVGAHIGAHAFGAFWWPAT